MELMGDGLIAFLAAVGVSTILWLLADCGLDETGLRLAQSLTQRYSRVQLCPAEELENYLK